MVQNGGEPMLNEQEMRILLSSALFKNGNSGAMMGELGLCKVHRYQKGAYIFSREVNPRALGVILSGTAQVEKGTQDHLIVMSRLIQGDVFGAVSLYASSEQYVTGIRAITPVAALLIPKRVMDKLIRTYPEIAVNYLTYLSERIYFLNRRIDSFTGGSAVQRLAGYFLMAETDTSGVPAAHLASALDIGRASLYRAFEELERAGAIRREGKLITVLSREKLQQYV